MGHLIAVFTSEIELRLSTVPSLFRAESLRRAHCSHFTAHNVPYLSSYYSWYSSSYFYSVPDLVKKKNKLLFFSFRIFTGNLQVNSNNPDIYSRLNLYKIPKLVPWIVNKISSTASSSSAFLSDWSPPSRG